MTAITELEQAVSKLITAQEDLKRATEEASRARSVECDKLNRANDAQKEFDKLVSDLRQQAPNGTDWKSMPRLKGEQA